MCYVFRYQTVSNIYFEWLTGDVINLSPEGVVCFGQCNVTKTLPISDQVVVFHAHCTLSVLTYDDTLSICVIRQKVLVVSITSCLPLPINRWLYNILLKICIN